MVKTVQLTDLHSFFIYGFFGLLFIVPLILLCLRIFSIREPKQRMQFYLLALASPLLTFVLYHTVLVKRCQAGFSPGVAGWRLFTAICSLGAAAVRYLSPLLAAILLIGIFKAFFAGLLVMRMRSQSVELGTDETRRVTSLIKKQSLLLGISAPEIIFLRRSDIAAFTAGLFRPVIIMSKELPRKLNDVELEAILTHELVHVSRGDTRKNWLIQLLGGVLFFSPFSSLLVRNYLLENERLCDREAVKVIGHRREYASALLKIWRIMLEEKEFRPGLAIGFTGQKRDMEARITTLINTPCGREVLPLTLLTTILVGSFAVTVFFLGFIC